MLSPQFFFSVFKVTHARRNVKQYGAEPNGSAPHKKRFRYFVLLIFQISAAY